MTEEQQPAQENTESSAPAQTPVSSEIAEGKAFAVLSYALSFIGIPFFIVPLIMRDNEFSLFHAKQCLILWLAGIVASVIGGILTLICIGVILLAVAAVFVLVLNIMGLINAVKGEQKPLPLIGKWGVDWFKGIKKI